MARQNLDRGSNQSLQRPASHIIFNHEGRKGCHTYTNASNIRGYAIEDRDHMRALGYGTLEAGVERVSGEERE